MSEEEVKSWRRTLVEKGGSVAATIPKEIRKSLDLKAGEQLKYYFKPGSNFAIIAKEGALEEERETVILLGENKERPVEMMRMPFSEEEIEEILREMEEKAK